MRRICLAGLMTAAMLGGVAVAEPLPIDSTKLEYGPTRFQLMLNGAPNGEMYYALEQRNDDIVLHEATTMMPDIREFCDGGHGRKNPRAKVDSSGR